METMLLALEGLLHEEIRAYTALVSRLPFKIALIKKNRVEQLERMVAQEEDELKRLVELEARRAATVRELLAHLPAGTPAQLSGLLPHLDLAWRAKLGELGDRLTQQIERLQEGHRTCGALLRTSLEFIDFTMDIVGQAVMNAQPALYGHEGPAGYSPSLLLDRRA